MIDASMPHTPITHPIRPQTGHLWSYGELWTAGMDGQLRDDITDALVDYRVRYDWRALTPGTLDATVRGPDVVEAITDCLVPVQVTEWDDRYGNHYRVREPLGVFSYLPPDRDYTRADQLNLISGMDVTWDVAQMTLGKPFVIDPGGAYLGLSAREMFLSGGETRIRTNHPPTAVRPAKRTTYRSNENALDKMNDLYTAAGYWPMVADRYGLVTTGPRFLAADQAPARIISSRAGDVLIPEAITFRPDRASFGTEVTLSSNNPEDAPDLRDGYKATLTDPASPYSRQRLGKVIALPPVMDDRSETFDVMRNRCLGMLEDASSMLGRYTIAVWPDPRFSPRETWDVEIEQDNGNVIATGRHRVESVEFGFTRTDGAMIATISRMFNVEQIA